MKGGVAAEEVGGRAHDRDVKGYSGCSRNDDDGSSAYVSRSTTLRLGNVALVRYCAADGIGQLPAGTVRQRCSALHVESLHTTLFARVLGRHVADPLTTAWIGKLANQDRKVPPRREFVEFEFSP
jgi:hypothetical protein